MTNAADNLTLRAGSLELELSPCFGGAIERFCYVSGEKRTPLLRECNSEPKSVLDLACFPLVPFVNRIRGGRFTFRGRAVTLRPNMAGDVSPLHGQGWLGEWSIVSSSDTAATLRFEHAAGEWPWHYEAAQHFSLDGEGLTLTLECRNLDPQPMPCGLGQHPYFPCGPDTMIDTAVKTAFEIDEHVLPVAQVPATGRFDLHRRKACGQDLDHGFGGWGGTATMTDPAWPAALRLHSDEARFFQLYSPAEGSIFVAEPVTHANAALNEPEERWAELGLKVLEPSEAMSLTMRLALVGA